MSEALYSLASDRISLSFFDSVAESLPDAPSSEPKFLNSLRPVQRSIFDSSGSVS